MSIDTSLWGWPQWTVIILFCLQIILTGVEHGKPKTGNNNIGVAIFSALLMMFFLTAGGFFA